MGDDVETHDARFEIKADTLEELVEWIQQSSYLPQIGGGKATWSMASNFPIAVFAQEWSSPRMLLLNPWMYLKKLNYDGDLLKIHFNYHAQTDPELVVEVLKRYRNE
jgi:hypothetical protein